MRRLLQIILTKPILWASNKFTSKPNREKIFEALSLLKKRINENDSKKGLTVNLKPGDKFIVFSDQHRGAKNGADDFMLAEPNYLAALDFYFQNKFSFISLGDCEELWENTLAAVKKNNLECFESEQRFILQNRFYKLFGNHDLYWDNDPLAGWQLKKIYGQEVNVYEGIIIKPASTPNEHPADSMDSEFLIFLTHGHQGDTISDGNWFSKFFIAMIWAPLQAYLKINPNTPAYDIKLKTEHNRLMYEWSAMESNLVLITGHTHQPVFESLTHPERLQRELNKARIQQDVQKIHEIESAIEQNLKIKLNNSTDFDSIKPSYFNSGCCCFSDGDITGIEITSEKIALIKWSAKKGREVLEQTSLSEISQQLK